MHAFLFTHPAPKSLESFSSALLECEGAPLRWWVTRVLSAEGSVSGFET